MALDADTVNLIAVVMASVSVAFMIPSFVLAYVIRKQLSKALLVLATSKSLYKYMFMVLAFAALGGIAHLIYHIGEFYTYPQEIELGIHVIIDSSFILVSASLFITFQTAYGLLRGGEERARVERQLRDSALKMSGNRPAERAD